MQTIRQVLFIQGGGEGTHDEWDDKLVASLERELGQDFEIRYPRMPNEDDPGYATWKPALEREIAALRPDAVLVGHSVGGTLLVGLLAESFATCKFGAVLLISAPFAGDGGWPSDELRFSPELGRRFPQGVPIHLFHGLTDETVPAAHVELYASAIPQAGVHRLPGRDHQLGNDMREVAAAIRSLES